jgi:hypothetical protein
MSRKHEMSKESIWFGVRMVFQCLGPNEGSRDRLYEERIILVKAATEEEARVKAERFGKASEHEYRNVDGKRIVWRFKKILDVACLSWETAIADGSEVYYALLDEKRFRQLESAIRP